MSKNIKARIDFNYPPITWEPLFVSDVDYRWWENDGAKWFIIIGGTLLSMAVFFFFLFLLTPFIGFFSVPAAFVASLVFAQIFIAIICST